MIVASDKEVEMETVFFSKSLVHVVWCVYYLIIGTFMIQSCNVTTPDHTSIIVVCTFAINSNVSGLVVVENEITNETLKKPLSQTRSVIFTGLEPGVQYRVRAYDDASSSTAAYEQSLFLNNIIPSPSCLKSSTIFPTGIQQCCSNAVVV